MQCNYSGNIPAMQLSKISLIYPVRYSRTSSKKQDIPHLQTSICLVFKGDIIFYLIL